MNKYTNVPNWQKGVIMQITLAASFRRAKLYKEIANGVTTFRLMWNDRLVATDNQFKYLNQIMYQIG